MVHKSDYVWQRDMLIATVAIGRREQKEFMLHKNKKKFYSVKRATHATSMRKNTFM